MKRSSFLLVFLLAASVSPLFAQHKVQMHNMYERLYLVVPMIGSGTAEDPRRPMYVPAPTAPTPGAATQPTSSGIIAFAFQESDDGQHAIVELVARDPGAFKPILEDHQPGVKIFRKGKDKKDDIETEFRKYIKDFDLDSLVVNVP